MRAYWASRTRFGKQRHGREGADDRRQGRALRSLPRALLGFVAWPPCLWCIPLLSHPDDPTFLPLCGTPPPLQVPEHHPQWPLPRFHYQLVSRGGRGGEVEVWGHVGPVGGAAGHRLGRAHRRSALWLQHHPHLLPACAGMRMLGTASSSSPSSAWSCNQVCWCLRVGRWSREGRRRKGWWWAGGWGEWVDTRRCQRGWPQLAKLHLASCLPRTMQPATQRSLASPCPSPCSAPGFYLMYLLLRKGQQWYLTSCGGSSAQDAYNAAWAGWEFALDTRWGLLPKCHACTRVPAWGWAAILQGRAIMATPPPPAAGRSPCIA